MLQSGKMKEIMDCKSLPALGVLCEVERDLQVLGVRRWRELVIGKNGQVFFDRPKPTAGCRANGRRWKCSRSGPDYVAYIVIFLSSNIIYRLYKLTLPAQTQVTLQLRVSLSDLLYISLADLVLLRGGGAKMFFTVFRTRSQRPCNHNVLCLAKQK